MPVAVPYPGRPGPYAGLAGVDVRADIAELYRTGAFNMATMFRDSLRAGALAQGGVVEAFALALEQLVRSSRNQLANLHHQVGALMQEAVVGSYEATRAARGGPPPYRLSQRDAGDRLVRALSDPEFFRGTYDGIGFANVNLLDREARQWHRLNFGALPEPGPRSRRFTVNWQGLALGSVGYDSAPSGPMFMPRGFFRGEGEFHPTVRGPGTAIYPTRGVRAWNFLDAGLEVFGREIGPAYDRLYAQWHDSAQRGVGPLSRVVTVRPTLPAPRLQRLG